MRKGIVRCCRGGAPSADPGGVDGRGPELRGSRVWPTHRNTWTLPPVSSLLWTIPNQWSHSPVQLRNNSYPTTQPLLPLFCLLHLETPRKLSTSPEPQPSLPLVQFWFDSETSGKQQMILSRLKTKTNPWNLKLISFYYQALLCGWIFLILLSKIFNVFQILLSMKPLLAHTLLHGVPKME